MSVADQNSGTKITEKRSVPRLLLGLEQFRLSKMGKLFSLCDLSPKGMAFWISPTEDQGQFSVGLMLEGIINLMRQKYPVKARVRRLSRDRVGCEFEDISSELALAITELMNPVRIGQELKPRPGLQKGKIWYQGPAGTDLLLLRSLDGQYQSLTLSVLNSFIQWESEEGLFTAQIQSSGQSGPVQGIVRLETLELEKDQTPDPTKLSIAKTVILSSKLPLELKNWCTRKLSL